MVCEQLAALARACGPGRARIRRSRAAFLPDTELRGALARRRARRIRCRNNRDEILKVDFRFISASRLYQTVYGALAIIPIFLLWMCIFVDGGPARRGGCRGVAELADRRAGRHDTIRQHAARLQLVVDRVAGSATARQHAGARRRARCRDDSHRRAFEAARQSQDAAHTQEGCWVMSWAPEKLRDVHDLYEALHLPLAGRWMGRAAQPWQRQVAPAMDRIVKAETAAMEVTIASLLAETLEPAPRRRGRWALRRGSGRRNRRRSTSDVSTILHQV